MRRIVIIGGGIMGSAIAYNLAWWRRLPLRLHQSG
jgi:glycine/D-amino acid oxidase-like deaminating enzyme